MDGFALPPGLIHPPGETPGYGAWLAGLPRRLWITPPPGGPFRPLEEMCAGWVRGFLKEYGNARALGRDQVDPGLARAGMALFRELPAAAPESVLLATDLHHDNVLASE